MVMRFLHATFRFKCLLFLFLFGVVSATFKAQAAVWFTTYNSGVLSGHSGTGVIYDYIPSIGSSRSLPAGFEGVAIQGSGVGSAPKANIGALVSSGSQSVRLGSSTTQDAYVRYTRLIFAGMDFNTLYSSVTNTLSSGCSGLLNSGQLEPGTWYRTSVSCAESALSQTATPGYRLRSDGVLILVVREQSSNTELNINNRVKSRDDGQRIVIITDAPVVISYTVGTPQASLSGYIDDYYDEVEPDIQAAFITTDSFTIGSNSSTTDTAVILEGPIVATNNVILSRNISDFSYLGTNYSFPGVYVKYNPLYISWISGGYSGLSGMFGSKVTWRYE